MNSLICSSCGETYPLDIPLATCPCGGYFDIEFSPEFDLSSDNKIQGLWKYRDALPIDPNTEHVSLGEMITPLVPIELRGRSVFVKQEQMMPTGSFKDRGASVLITKAKELGLEEIVEDSSGNAGCAIAAYSANAGIKAKIFVPSSASGAKLAQIKSYGAELNMLDGPRENAEKAAIDESVGSYYASHARNPFFFHGVKTIAFEIFEQLGSKPPDVFIVPAGNGTLLIGAWIGFKDLFNSGLIKKLPKMIAVQAFNCAPLYEYMNGNMKEERSRTIAEGIAVNRPVRIAQMADIIKESGGEVIAVSENEINESYLSIAKKGFWIEPTSAAVIPGIEKYLSKTFADELIVSVFTGHGLKSPHY